MVREAALRCRHASQGGHGGAVSEVALSEGRGRCWLPGRGRRPRPEAGNPALVSCGALIGKSAQAHMHTMRGRCRH